MNRFSHDLKAQIGRIRQLVNRTLPVKIGRMARLCPGLPLSASAQ